MLFLFYNTDPRFIFYYFLKCLLFRQNGSEICLFSFCCQADSRLDGTWDSREKTVAFSFDYCYWSVDPEDPKYASQEMVSDAVLHIFFHSVLSFIFTFKVSDWDVRWNFIFLSAPIFFLYWLQYPCLSVNESFHWVCQLW